MRFIIKIHSFREIEAVTRLIDPSILSNSLHYDHNRSYHCSQCGKIWAEWIREDGQNEEWYPFRRSCGIHAEGRWTGDRPGSIILYPTDILVIPRALLEAEVLLTSERKEDEPRADERT